MLLWLLAMIGVAPAVAALRAYWIERREGLTRSTLRAIVAPSAALLLLALTWGYGNAVLQVPAGAPAAGVAAPSQPSPSTSASDYVPVPAQQPPLPEQLAGAAAANPRIADLTREIVELIGQRDDLTRQIDEKQAQLRALTQPADQSPPRTGPPPPSLPELVEISPRTWPLYLALALLIVGVLALFLGDLSTLLPRSRRAKARSSQPEAVGLSTLAEHVQAGRWTAALDCAAQIAIEQLPKLELLDFLFLRALASTLATCAPEPSVPALSRDRRAELLRSASDDLTRLREIAPHMAEAMWLHGYVGACEARWQDALDLFRQARPELADLAFDHHESVCLLHLGADCLTKVDHDGATRLFDEVAKLGVLAHLVPMVIVTQRILPLRADIKMGRFRAASEAIARIRQVEGLDDKDRRAIAAVCDVYELVIRHRSGELAEALDADVALLQRWQPDKLPALEDQIADEFLHPAIDRAVLSMPAELYRALYFLEAVLRVELAARHGRPLDVTTVEAIASALLRALQFEPRQRDALAALAALYLAHRPERTERALTWLDAALVLGVRSRKVQTLYLEVRRAENEHKDLLALFRSASARFLADPALGPQVRGALIEELGRFDEFRPVVLDLRRSGALDVAAPQDVTIRGLHERAAFVAHLVTEITQRTGDNPAKLLELHRELDALAANVDTSAKRIGTLEHAVMEQLGRIVLR